MPEPKLHEAVFPDLKQQYTIATSSFDSQEPTLTMTPMRSANPELRNWYEQFLDPTINAYFETYMELRVAQCYNANTAQAKTTCRR